MFIGSANRLTNSPAAQSPALCLDLRLPTLDSRLAFTRSSAATDVINGVLTAFAADQPRISVANGLLMEENRTNSLRNANALGAVPGIVGSGGALPTNWAVATANGLTTEDVESATRNGFSYVRVRISGTPSGSVYALRFDSTTQIAALSGESWSGSVWLAQAAGSQSNISAVQMAVEERDSSGTSLTASTSGYTVGSAFVRLMHTRLLTQAGTARVTNTLRLATIAAAVVDITLDIAAPQLEKGAFASSYIPTSGAAATRGYENCTMPVGEWFNSVEGTLLAEATAGAGIDTAASYSYRLLRLEYSTTDRHELIRGNADNTFRGATAKNNISQSSIVGGSWPALTRQRAAYAYRHNDMAISVAGGAVASDTTSPEGMPTGLNLLRIGSASNSASFNGYVRFVGYWRQRLSNDQLRSMTS